VSQVRQCIRVTGKYRPYLPAQSSFTPTCCRRVPCPALASPLQPPSTQTRSTRAERSDRPLAMEQRLQAEFTHEADSVTAHLDRIFPANHGLVTSDFYLSLGDLRCYGRLGWGAGHSVGGRSQRRRALASAATRDAVAGAATVAPYPCWRLHRQRGCLGGALGVA
jgi:hypothetical protein